MRLLTVVVAVSVAVGCADPDGSGAGLQEQDVVPAATGQPPPGHGGPNPGWGGAPPPGRGHGVPPGHLGDPGNPEWFHQDAPRIVSATASETHVTPGTVVSLQVEAIDPGGLPLHYAWSATQGNVTGPTRPLGNEVVWTAPFINSMVKVTVKVENSRHLPAFHDFVLHVVGDLGDVVYVSPGGSDSNSGSPSAPYATVQGAIDAAAAAGVGNVVLAAGTYQERLHLPSNINLWGQYDPATWSHQPSSATVIASPSSVAIEVADPPAAPRGPSPQSIVNRSPSGSIQGMIVTSSDAAIGHSSMVILFNNVSGTFVVQDNTLQAGAGGRGLSGPSALLQACGGGGGGGGNFTGPGAPGGTGCFGNLGAAPGVPGAAGGGNAGQGGDGGPGQSGAPGTVSPTQDEGQVVLFDWAAFGGANGGGGGGGSGGGGGGGGLICAGPLECAPTLGAAGGGGGRGGGGGGGGAGAGGSMAVLAIDSPGRVRVLNNTVFTAGGGAGGNGGNAAAGEGGALGGPAGAGCWAGICWAWGGGGSGGWGGNGGGGAGGAGGMSVGVAHHNLGTLTDVGNVYFLGPAGSGGAGGWPGGATGKVGIRAPRHPIP